MGQGANQEPSIVGGIYEAVMAVPNLLEAAAFWGCFGYRVVHTGQLDRADAKALYGVDSAVTAIRLGHGRAEQGLVRLVCWEKPIGEGLGLVPFRCLGERHTGTFVRDVMQVYDHVQAARAQGWKIDGVKPFMGDPVAAHTTGDTVGRARPFADPIVGVRDITLLTPYARMYVSERVNYDMPNYGNAARDALFEASQFTAVNIVTQDDSREALRFYDEVLGMWRRSDVEAGGSNMAQVLWDAPPEEVHNSLDFDMQASGKALHERLPGVLKVARFKSTSRLPDYRDKSRPGNLGLSLFTARVQPIAAMREKMLGAGATGVTPILRDEFGQRAYSCVAPDGYDWTFIEGPPSNPYMHGGARPRR